MHSPEIPEDVLRFITTNIDAVPQLEALLLMWENPARSWDCDELAGRIYVGRDMCVDILHVLQRRGLVSADASGRRFSYSSAWDPTGAVMPNVATAYRRNLVQIATFIHSRAPSAVREFARAFDFKKDR